MFRSSQHLAIGFEQFTGRGFNGQYRMLLRQLQTLTNEDFRSSQAALVPIGATYSKSFLVLPPVFEDRDLEVLLCFNSR